MRCFALKKIYLRKEKKLIEILLNQSLEILKEKMMLKNEPEEDELNVVIGDEDSELIERLKEIIKVLNDER